jgi:hypothetical protein
MIAAQCILCDQRFLLGDERAPLPAHVYRRGLLRGRRCPSTYGIPSDEAVALQPVLTGR